MPSAVSLTEFLTDSDSDSPDSSHVYEGSYKFARIAPPCSYDVERFRSSHPSLSSSGAFIEPEGDVAHKYDLNWCNIDNYITYWDKLSREDKLTLEDLLGSDLSGNANRFGLKRKDLEAHLLLNIGCDMTNIVNNGKDSVRSNLLSRAGAYSSECLDTRAVDAKTCRRFAAQFKKSYSVERLFEAGFVAYQAVITLDKSVSLQDPQACKEMIQSFFKTNALELSRLCHKKKLLPSYMRSHEISVSSIEKGLYDPHTHLLFFIPKEKKQNYAEHKEKLRMIEEEFNKNYSDRKLEILRDSNLEFKAGKTYASIEKAVDYLFNAYSLASQYLREVRSDNLRELNKATVECYHNLIWLCRGDSLNTGIQRFGKSHIPSRDEAGLYMHPLLQKKKKSNTIKKVITLSNEQNEPSTSEKSPLGRADEQREDSRLSVPRDSEAGGCPEPFLRGNSAGARGDTREECSREAKRGIKLSSVSESRAEKNGQPLRECIILRDRDRRFHKECRMLREGSTNRGGPCMGRNC
jgi:hypothetical protein